jgi:PEP-CTERM motif
MKKLSVFLLILGMVVTGSTAAYGSYDVYSSGPLGSTSIDFFIADSGPSSISKITYSLQDSYVIDSSNPIFNVVNPAGGTSTYFVNGSFNAFGFNFTSFDVGDSFSFSWDPDKVGDPSYGAIISELAGTQVTLVTGAGTLNGTMVIDPTQNHLVTVFSQVPEPLTLMLLGLGLVGVASLRKRM